jgi:tRNA 5-methylaminomethyl-2-thiouridine biosynthesis bifunctional protein
MAEPVVWDASGNPRSERFNDLYRSQAGGLAQARRVFLGGCGLPQAWAGRAQWRVLETGFGLGLNFLATWQAWQGDPARPGLLHYAAVEGFPVAAEDIRRSAASFPELAALADALCAQWHGLLPGVHRLVFDGGRVTLTLAVGDVRPALRELTLVADCVYLDGFAPATNPDMWSVATLKGVARCCARRTRVATWSTATPLREALAECGFQVARTEGPPPRKHRLEGRYDPPWVLKRPALPAPVRVARCAVVGGGLAGAAVAASLARRGWRVQVLDAAPRPAAGASGLPAGVLAPHVAVDDPPVSRLSRAGVRATGQVAGAHLRSGEDWLPGGVLEHRVDGSPGLPAGWRTPDAAGAARAWSTDAPADRCNAAGLAAGARPALWHPQGGWVRPAKLVQALLAHEHIEWLGGRAVARIERRPLSGPASGPLDAEPIGDEPPPWQVLDATGQVLAEAELVVLAAGHATRAWLGAGGPPLQAVRGQVSFGALDGGLAAALPPFPVNGHGSVVAGVPAEVDGVAGHAPEPPPAADRIWVVGASYERDVDQPLVRDADHTTNLERLRALAPEAAHALAGAFGNGSVRGWAGVRCATPDRLPLVGPTRLPGVWVSTGMGSRGISLAVLCGELMAAWLRQEPLPVEAALAKRLHSGRFGKAVGKG